MNAPRIWPLSLNWTSKCFPKRDELSLRTCEAEELRTVLWSRCVAHRLADALHHGVGRHEPRGGRVGLVALLAVLLCRDLSDVREGNLHRLGLAGAALSRDEDRLCAW